jgi:hypothetical protein
MAKCPECKHFIASDAKRCPNCDADIAGRRGSGCALIMMGLIMVVVFGGIIVISIGHWGAMSGWSGWEWKWEGAILLFVIVCFLPGCIILTKSYNGDLDD